MVKPAAARETKLLLDVVRAEQPDVFQVMASELERPKQTVEKKRGPK